MRSGTSAIHRGLALLALEVFGGDIGRVADAALKVAPNVLDEDELAEVKLAGKFKDQGNFTRRLKERLHFGKKETIQNEGCSPSITINAEAYAKCLANICGLDYEVSMLAGPKGEFDSPPWLPAAVTQEHKIPVESHAAFTVRTQILPKGNVLYGRGDNKHYLHQFLAGQPKKLLVQAPAGTGKTSLLAWLVMDCQAQGLDTLYHFFSSSRGLTSSEECYRELASQPAMQAVQKEGTDKDRVLSLLRTNRPNGRPLLIVLDGLDEADRLFTNTEHISFAELGKGVKLICSVRVEENFLPTNQYGWKGSDGQDYFLKELTPDGIAEWLKATGEPTLVSQANDYAQRLSQVAGGLPLLLQYLIEDLVERVKAGDKAPPASINCSGLDDYVRTQVTEMKDCKVSERGMKKFMLDLLAILCFTESQMPLVDLTEFLNWDSYLEGDDADWPQVFKRWWYRVGERDGSKVACTHPGLARAFMSNPLILDHLRKAAPKMLDFYFGEGRNLEGYGLQFGVANLVRWLDHDESVTNDRAKWREVLSDVLTDPVYVQRKIDQYGAPDYLREAESALKVLE